MPGQYITGNQLYSGMPYGMSQPMGMFAQPMIYQPPQMSQQYMPNRGLMSGYSTGFGLTAAIEDHTDLVAEKVA